MSARSTGAALPDGTHPARVDLAVDDRQRVLGFYREVIGLRVLDSRDDGLDLGAGDAPLVRLHERPDLGPRPPDAAGLYHLALRVPDRGALGAAARRLLEADALTGASDHAVSEALYTRDPAGNGVEVYRDRPRDAWPGTAERVRMTTEPLALDDLTAAGPPADGDHLPPGADLGHVHLEVTDLDRAVGFYVDALGLAERDRFPGARFVAAGGYHHHVGLNVWGSRTAPAAGLGLAEVALAVPDAAAIEAAVDRLELAGHPVEDGLTADPDGIAIRLVPGP